jgi:putative holliday junction resolvase
MLGMPEELIAPGMAAGESIRAPVRAPVRTFLAFDFGLRRIGVATGNTLTRSAQPLRTIASSGDERFADIARLVADWQPHALVVGVPFHPDGAEHEHTVRARKFARQLHGRLHLEVHEVDERYTSVEARAQGATDLDAASAALILEQYLQSDATSSPP